MPEKCFRPISLLPEDTSHFVLADKEIAGKPWMIKGFRHPRRERSLLTLCK
jgi:hypothetical protein